MSAPIRKVTINYGMEMPSWFDLKSPSEFKDSTICEKQFRESVDRVKKVVDEEAKLLKDSKKIVIGGFS